MIQLNCCSLYSHPDTTCLLQMGLKMQEFNCLLMEVRDRNQKKTFASGDGPENESIS